MEVWLNLALIAVGIAALYWGAEWLVKGSAGIALHLGVSPLVIGLTIVALGTSSPELFVCIGLNLAGSADAAAGNVVGSNICNILLVLGVSALVRPVVIKAQIIRRDAPILIAVTLLFIGLVYDGRLMFWEGIVLTVLIVIYIIISFRLAKLETNSEVIQEFEAEIGSLEEARKHPRSLLLMSGLVLIGIIVLVVGSKLLKDGALEIAYAMGISEAIIGLTLVAFGTSLPELATSIVASLRDEGDIVTGNAIGSSIFNILAVLGITILFGSMVVTGIEQVDIYFMLGSAALVLPMMWTRERLSRPEGIILVAGYIGYCLLLAQRASG